MRVVAFLVVACGCRVGAPAFVDGAIPVGDGLPARVITDAALWADVRVADGATDAAGPDRGNDAVISEDGRADGGAGGVDADADGPCQLLVPSCPDLGACYPYPFESAVSGQTRCAFQGTGGPSVPCQSQLECDGTTICAAPGRPDSVCLPRCDLLNPRCAVGTDCILFANHPGVGVCR